MTAVPLAKRDWSGKRDFFSTVKAIEERLKVAAVLKKPESMQDLDELHDRHLAGTARE